MYKSKTANGYDAGAQLVAAGLIPENCYKLSIHFDLDGTVRIETHCHAWGEQWDKIMDVIKNAKAAGAIDGTVTMTNLETSESVDVDLAAPE